MEIVVLDASALVAIALFEPEREALLQRIQSAPGGVIIHAVNVFEVVSKLMSKGIPEMEAW
jgi:PIN domain nuclease of toxin-antitoxin system